MNWTLSRAGKLKPRSMADQETLKFAERLLASAIGTASARVVMALLLQRGAGHTAGAMRLLDDASDAIVYNRDLLQSAIDHVEQGIVVFDHDLGAGVLEHAVSQVAQSAAGVWPRWGAARRYREPA